MCRTCVETQSKFLPLSPLTDFGRDSCGMSGPFGAAAEGGNCIKVSVSGVIPPCGLPFSRGFHAVSARAGGEGGWSPRPGPSSTSLAMVLPALGRVVIESRKGTEDV